MATLAISIDVPPVGELETAGDGSSPIDAQMAQEQKARQKLLDAVSPYFKSLSKRPPHRTGNVSRVELLGRGTWSQLNHYLVLVTIDSGGTDIAPELSRLLPKGSKVTVVGDFESLQKWPEPKLA